MHEDDAIGIAKAQAHVAPTTHRKIVHYKSLFKQNPHLSCLASSRSKTKKRKNIALHLNVRFVPSADDKGAGGGGEKKETEPGESARCLHLRSAGNSNKTAIERKYPNTKRYTSNLNN